MKKRLLSLVLCLVMVFSLFPMIDAPVFAADENGTITNPAPAQDTSGNLHLTKNLAPGANGTYDITMESWATGEVKTHVYNEQIPTDYVLIADQSGSMSTNDVPTGYNDGTTKNWKVSDGANAYYYKETDANGVDHYYRVYRKYGDMFQYHARDTVYSGSCVSNLSWFQRESDQDLGKASQYYYNPSLDNSGSRVGSATDNRFYPVTVSAKGGVGYYGIRFRFTDVNGTSNYLRYPDQPYYKSPTGGLFGPGDTWGLLFGYDFCNSTCKGLTRNDSTQYTYGKILSANTGMYVRQVLFTRHVDYSQLAYRDDNGVEHLLIDATYCNSSGTPVGGACGANGVPSGNHTSTTEAYWNGTLYSATGKTTTRLNALKQAMNEFVNTVAAQQNDDGSKPNHRVAIVGFAGGSDSNTELLTGINLDTSASNKTGIRYSRLDTDDYKEALLDVTDSGQLQKLKNAVQALDASGGTEGQYGFYMAKNILDQRELTKFTTKGNKEVDRLTIVVYFTDGTPGNYDNDNQYAYGNEVVDAAHQLKTDTKVPNVEIYSIGTFGFADSEPLVYEKYTGNNDEYKFDPDYVKTLPGTWNSGYMYRLWLRNTQGYGDVATDTVYDYMRTITTEYPNATKFVDASWYGTGTKSDSGVYTNMVQRVRGDSNGLRRYFLATDLSGLSRVFTTIGSEEASSSSTVTLNDQATLQDKVNLTYFDVANASTEAYTVVANKDGTFGTSKVQTLNAPLDKDTGVVTVSGFDYSTKYVTSLQDGEKLVVKIKGLTAKQPGTNMPSNDGNAFIKAKDAEANAIEIASPTLTLQAKPNTYLIDFNAKMTVATDTSKLLDAEDNTVAGTNGNFVKSGSNVTYQLNSANQSEKTAVINNAYTGVDSATIYGTPVNGTAGWNEITTVPASSVYYDDDLAKDTTPAVTVGDGSGKISGVNDDNVSKNAGNVDGSFYFTFYGTGIDVYCTTHKNGGYVSAGLFQCDYSKTKELTNRITDQQNKPVTVKNYSAENLYNTPTISFSNLTADTYTVKINANSTAQFKLDGVRVYNPVKETENGVQTAAASELAKSPEADANYLNLRKLLLNDDGTGGFTVTNSIPTGDVDPSAVSGVLFIDDVDSVVTMSHYRKEYNATTKTWETVMEDGKPKWFEEEAPIYQTQFDVYKANGPKNEIYLDGQQGITFQLSDKVPVGSKVWIGLSAPVDGSGSVSITGKYGNVSVTSVMDMYYDFTVPDGRQITITNLAEQGSGDIISVTNLKITGIADLIPAATQNNQNDVLRASKAVFNPVTIKSIRMAANDGVDPETVVDPIDVPDPEPTEVPDPEPTAEPDPAPSDEPTETPTPSVTSIVRQLISSFVSRLFGSVSRLFGN